MRTGVKFESYDYLVDQVFPQFNKNSINNQHSHSQIENYETPAVEYPNENDLGDTDRNKASAMSTFMPKILPDDEIAKNINSLNSKQR